MRAFAIPIRPLLALTLLALVLPATTHAQDTSVSVANAPPLVGSVTLPSGAVSPVAGGSTNVTTTVVVTDANGCGDLAAVNVTVLRADGATHRAALPAAYVRCDLGTSAMYRATFAMNYYDAAGLGVGAYAVEVRVVDRQGAAGDNLADLAYFEYAELASLRLGSSSVDFGSVDPGNASALQSLTVENYGNVVMDTQLAGTDLTHGEEAVQIAVGSVRYGLASDFSDAAGLSSSATTLGEFDLAPGAGSARNLYWQLSVPDASSQWVPSGVYAGTMTVTSVKG